MNELIRLLAILIFGNLGLVAFFVVVSALFPRRVGRTRAIADAMPGRAFAVPRRSCRSRTACSAWWCCTT